MLSRKNFYKKLEEICDSFREQTFNKFYDKTVSLGTGYEKELNPKWEASKARDKCEELFYSSWNKGLENKISMINGKNLRKKFYEFIKEEYNQDCTNDIVFKEMNEDEIHEDVKNVISDLIEGVET